MRQIKNKEKVFIVSPAWGQINKGAEQLYKKTYKLEGKKQSFEIFLN